MTSNVVPLNQQYPERKPDQVTTFDLLSSSTIGWRANPDTLVGRHGLAIYSKMSNDEQVKAALVFKRDAITARGWQLKFPDESKLSVAEQQQRVRVFGRVVAKMRGSFADALNAIMTGRAYGFSVTEKVYGQIDVDGKTWPAINMLLGRDPLSFRFYTDEYGTLEKIEQQAHRSGVIEVDRARVIHYVHAPEWDHVYGRSDLREAYRSWYIKEQISGLWPLYLERFAGGFMHAETTTEANLTVPEQEALDSALKNAKSLGAIRTPPGVKLNVIHPPGQPDAYERALQFHDLAISKALLVPNLLGISQSGGGSYAQSQTQLEAFFWTLNADATRLEECLNEQLFRDLGDQCWGDGEYPEFRFKPASIEHVKWMVDTWLKMVAGGTALATEEDEGFLRKLLDLPARDEKSKTIAEAQQERAPAPPPPAAGAPAVDDDAPDDEDEEPKKKTPVGKGELREFARDHTCVHDDCDEMLAFAGPRGAACSVHWREVFHSPGGNEHDQKDHAWQQAMAYARTPVLYVEFTDEAAASAWLQQLRVGDGFTVPEAYAFGEAPDTYALAIPVKGMRGRTMLPAGARLTITKKKGTAMEARYDAALA